MVAVVADGDLLPLDRLLDCNMAMGVEMEEWGVEVKNVTLGSASEAQR